MSPWTGVIRAANSMDCSLCGFHGDDREAMGEHLANERPDAWEMAGQRRRDPTAQPDLRPSFGGRGQTFWNLIFLRRLRRHPDFTSTRKVLSSSSFAESPAAVRNSHSNGRAARLVKVNG